ncbi:amino acid ABC transporter membrane protein, PAAT family [Acetitomaculum ruminis DSM 5522]|uniref:Amino acid ABC transporter membrane protein, PAAT family n=1 Tax=Acetitomaculum ruminis DSM 5522 TaxID=1120918 RepID=A0A1I0ZBR8_9FIRM|nr:amino acid ABC transporter permease [Acetitomaculum ruminis]SFB23074.1 amino acid ABC transporter membrane protein, PAAT family [Acetitomaculum ruminis DSM 5522]
MESKTFWDWVSVILDQYWPMFLQGAGVTMLIAMVGTILGFIIGLIVASIRTIPVRPQDHQVKKAVMSVVNFLIAVYVEVFRGTPMMVQAMIVYYGLMEAFNIDLAPLTAAFLIVSINTGAYMAEIVRGGIDSVDDGQFDAAHAIGMTHWQTMFNVVLPQAIRNILPAIGNEFVINIKDTSVLNVISVSELFFVTKTVKGIALRTFETFFIAGIVYLVLTFTVTRILRYIEKKMDGSDSYTIMSSSTMPENGLKIKGGFENR